MKKVKKIPNCCSYNSPGFTYSQPFQTDAQMVLDLKLSYEHPPKARSFLVYCRVLKAYGHIEEKSSFDRKPVIRYEFASLSDLRVNHSA